MNPNAGIMMRQNMRNMKIRSNKKSKNVNNEIRQQRYLNIMAKCGRIESEGPENQAWRIWQGMNKRKSRYSGVGTGEVD